jgi:hypothetical protein
MPPSGSDEVLSKDSIVLFGGAVQGGGTSLGDTWEWNGRVWTQVASFGATPCAGAAAAYNGDAIGLFGGIESLTGDPQARVFANTWEWSGERWVLRQDFGPRARWAHAIAFDNKRNHMVLLGGLAGPAADVSALLGDTWEHSEQADPAPTLQSVSVGPSHVHRQANLTITVTLTAPAGSAGVSVELSTAPPDVVVFLDRRLDVEPGATSQEDTFPVHLHAPIGPAHVIARVGQNSRSAPFEVMP